MEEIQISDLVFKLALYMLIAKDDAERKNIERKRTRNGNLIEVCEGISPKKMSDEHYFQIVQFYKFLIENEDLTDEDVEKVLKTDVECYGKRFKFLLKLNNRVPNFFNELKTLGPENFALKIVSKSKIQKDNEI